MPAGIEEDVELKESQRLMALLKTRQMPVKKAVKKTGQSVLVVAVLMAAVLMALLPLADAILSGRTKHWAVRQNLCLAVIEWVELTALRLAE